MPGNCVPVRGRGEQPQARQAARNESEAHPMSPEKVQKKTMEPSPFEKGEGYQGWTLVNPAMSGRDQNDDRSSHRHGVVCGHGMPETVGVLREEICAGGRHGPTAGTSGERREARLAGAEVGDARSSNEAANPRGAKGPHLVEVNSETQDCAMAPFGEIATTNKIQAFQRTLCRIAKRFISTAYAVNDLGELDAGNPPVQFDEGWGVPGEN